MQWKMRGKMLEMQWNFTSPKLAKTWAAKTQLVVSAEGRRRHVMPHIILNQKWAQQKRGEEKGGCTCCWGNWQTETQTETERDRRRGRERHRQRRGRQWQRLEWVTKSSWQCLFCLPRLPMGCDYSYSYNFDSCLDASASMPLPDSLQSAAIKLTKCWLLHTAAAAAAAAARRCSAATLANL